ncbi:hypothetical protein [Bryobacter aggregatus]|uniref:hypothetical protein n=1 Tax=Bryobacter aggregatus TaxID=360054 RepID=UPI0012BADE4A|nr:hypothetical protein [Bryobacter aggregatus]
MKWIVLLVLSQTLSWGQVGVYVLEGVHEAASELTLHADGSFAFGLIYGAADYWGKGTWKLEGNSVVLQSTGKVAPFFRLLKSSAGDASGVKVWVQGSNGRGVENIDVALRTGSESVQGRTNEEGIAFFPKLKDVREVGFEVSVFGVEFGPIPVAKGMRDFVFAIDGNAIQEMRFEAERLVHHNGMLELRKFDPAKPSIYRRK